MAGQTANRVKNILWGLFVGAMGIGMIIGGIVSLSAEGKPECGSQTITEGYVCNTNGVSRTAAEQAAENESSSHTGGWILLGLGVLMAGGSLMFFSEARGAARQPRQNPMPPNPWPTTPTQPPTYPQQPSVPPQSYQQQQPPGPPKIDYRKRR
ncbi:hypothetical protein GOEFS_012_00210 [Gordonia effusa NBRC 100432]|uniref:Uncharacterized protein n=1 Tax=Gordonia effusa NBRC 100432 TaxID=1077974 RepID=H0QV69_9ACTN|nr:hypothetical protein [Gordonia effusa]GAB16720.1 hypothetical protein GOEFS_012_00210 [Gordonia effusa NBRC 100432]